MGYGLASEEIIGPEKAIPRACGLKIRAPKDAAHAHNGPEECGLVPRRKVGVLKIMDHPPNVFEVAWRSASCSFRALARSMDANCSFMHFGQIPWEVGVSKL